MGLMNFINLCFADETDRAVSSASIQGTTAFNLRTPPEVRLLLGTRWFDFRPLLAGLSDAERERIMALTPQVKTELAMVETDLYLTVYLCVLFLPVSFSNFHR